MQELVTLLAQYLVIVPIVAVGIVFFKLDKGKRSEFVVYAVKSVILAVIFVKFATTLHQDPRPFIRDGVTPYFKGSLDNGFPSDHTTFSALIAFIVTRYYRKTGITLLAVAIVIGASRVIAGVHHTQDVVAGIVIAAIACGGAYLMQKAGSQLKNQS